MKKTEFNDNSRFLLISAKPAPNGSLHLGHISGPFLAQDMYYRHYTFRGAVVKVISGTDPIDSFVYLKAKQQECSHKEIYDKYYQAILSNFCDFAIHYDEFINPLNNFWKENYKLYMDELFTESIKQAKVKKIAKPFPFTLNYKPLSGSSIQGICPDCNNKMSGYFCESCGAHIDPSELVDLSFNNGNKSLIIKDQEDYFFIIKSPLKLINNLQLSGIRLSELNIVKKQFDKNRCMVRLTEISDNGIFALDTGKVYFGHGLLYAYCRLIGDIYKRLTNIEINPFDQESNTKTINFFGIDNTVSHMVNIQGIAQELLGWKGFDHFVVNHFLLLNGKKFSTSLGHVISIDSFSNWTSLEKDGVRFVLAAISPSVVQQNITPTSFLRWYNDVFIALIAQSIVYCLDYNKGQNLEINCCDSYFASLWDQVCDLFDYAKFDPSKIVQIIQFHCNEMRSISQSNNKDLITRLLQLLVLLMPICPRLVTTILQILHISQPFTLSTVMLPIKVKISKDYQLQLLPLDEIRILQIFNKE